MADRVLEFEKNNFRTIVDKIGSSEISSIDPTYSEVLMKSRIFYLS